MFFNLINDVLNIIFDPVLHDNILQANKERSCDVGLLFLGI